MQDNNETRLLKEIESAMNRSSFSYKAFASAIPSLHAPHHAAGSVPSHPRMSGRDGRRQQTV